MPKSVYEKVHDYYFSEYSRLGTHQFHFFSRHYLWFKDSVSRKHLDRLRPYILGTTKEEINERFERKLSGSQNKKQRVHQDLRKPYIEKYPLIEKYMKCLLHNLYMHTIYGKNLSEYLTRHIETQDLLSYRGQLLEDPSALLTLSTLAINFLYTFDYYLEQLGNTTNKLDPKRLLSIGLKQGKDIKQKAPALFIYYYTHCIINASNFYANPIQNHRDIYKQMLRELELFITERYVDISLDNKFEFLVCCKLLNFQSTLETRIKHEANHSLSTRGDFLIDIQNSCKINRTFAKSEHRNVLYLMAFGEENI
ncbi:hypothetical protein KC717_05515 [Candidatus Dojkabacteria bacterium]|uniref:Uncharacterized protein n=1 Tax=Candidatus Dojkabacteria bacterium TaxID=2099670 RepID=A0A955RKN9_9BACT|nr:hypothetical protein [Candidatus Dojkabacteria bacterium]